MSTYAIGDIQGCYDELRRLLDEIGFDPARDRLWLGGDLVNRGPQSLAVLRFVRGLGAAALTVLGNHDLHLVVRAMGFDRPRRDDTFQDVLEAPDGPELVDWLRLQPLIHVEPPWAMVHAGLLPQWTLARAQALAREAQEALRGPRHREFLGELYGSDPDRWDDALAGAERLRVIVNAMTRMRFCTIDGVMEFRSKGEVEHAPPGFMPWFEVPGRRSSAQRLICGHWSALGLRLGKNFVALDSGCVWGGSLTAFRLEDRRVFQAACSRFRRPGGPAG
ncbi:MAG: symmetrical bis(5'-nucleosyl)-tetraphosphatase [Burkholderiales bacterium]|nr:symmetrical bis(5'-nucleosyl)-tetraphosphatase [Burkholderiales bacterium]